jgi:hypothetical protein
MLIIYQSSSIPPSSIPNKEYSFFLKGIDIPCT